MQINDKTTIPLWAVFSSIPFIVGMILWISFVAYQGDANAQALQDMKTERSEIVRMLFQIREDLAAIREQLKERR